MRELIDKIRKVKELRRDLNTVKAELDSKYLYKYVILNHDKYQNVKVRIINFNLYDFYAEIEVPSTPDDYESLVGIDHISLAFFRDGRFKMYEDT
jgi:hypothetical protein